MTGAGTLPRGWPHHRRLAVPVERRATGGELVEKGSQREDVPLLVERILETLGASACERAAPLRSAEFLRRLAGHAWPGNVRELRNHVERALALHAADDPGQPSEPDRRVVRPLRAAREAWLSAFERPYLQDLLAKADGNVTVAARLAGVDRIHFYRLLWKHNLR